MKAIIDHKVYDTTTAEAIGFWENMADDQNFHYMSESLYKTKNAAIFVHAKGGSMTSLARHEGRTTYAGQAIFPLTKAQAVDWCSRTGNEATALRHFSDSLAEA